MYNKLLIAFGWSYNGHRPNRQLLWSDASTDTRKIPVLSRWSGRHAWGSYPEYTVVHGHSDHIYIYSLWRPFVTFVGLTHGTHSTKIPGWIHFSMYITERVWTFVFARFPVEIGCATDDPDHRETPIGWWSTRKSFCFSHCDLGRRHCHSPSVWRGCRSGMSYHCLFCMCPSREPIYIYMARIWTFSRGIGNSKHKSWICL